MKAQAISCKCRTQSAFTLVELLVVISIVVLLISILLPVIQQAEKAVHASTCGNNLRQIGIGMNAYTVDNNEFMPGPNTSGYDQLESANESEATRSANKPITADDWISPVFGLHLALNAENRSRKARNILNNPLFNCPMNEFRFERHRGGYNASQGGAIGTLNYASYSAPYAMHAYDNMDQAIRAGQPRGFFLGTDDARAINLPTKHRFRLMTLGPPSTKVMVADGANEHERVSGSNWLTLDLEYGSRGSGGLPDGGPFMSRGAVLNSPGFASATNPYKQRSSDFSNASVGDFALQITYRHQKTINVLFWDGHVESRDVAESREASIWFPTGSEVASNFYIGDENVRRRDILK